MPEPLEKKEKIVDAMHSRLFLTDMGGGMLPKSLKTLTLSAVEPQLGTLIWRLKE